MSVWKWPVVTAVSSSAALAIGLFFEGWVDALCWIGLGVPVVQSIWYWKLRRPGYAAR